MNAHRLLVGVLASLPILSFASFAQTPAKETPPQVHTLPPVKAELVEIDVVVTDRKGEPLRGLRPEDFEVLENGKRQVITHFKDGRGRPVPVRAEAPARTAAETPPA